MTTYIWIINYIYYCQKVRCYLSWQRTFVSLFVFIVKKYVFIFHDNVHLYHFLFLSSKSTLSSFMTMNICIIICFLSSKVRCHLSWQRTFVSLFVFIVKKYVLIKDDNIHLYHYLILVKIYVIMFTDNILFTTNSFTQIHFCCIN